MADLVIFHLISIINTSYLYHFIDRPVEIPCLRSEATFRRKIAKDKRPHGVEQAILPHRLERQCGRMGSSYQEIDWCLWVAKVNDRTVASQSNAKLWVSLNA
jgi:hypothetical protein